MVSKISQVVIAGFLNHQQYHYHHHSFWCMVLKSGEENLHFRGEGSHHHSKTSPRGWCTEIHSALRKYTFCGKNSSTMEKESGVCHILWQDTTIIIIHVNLRKSPGMFTLAEKNNHKKLVVMTLAVCHLSCTRLNTWPPEDWTSNTNQFLY